jgi:phenylpyruvate tautomerase PptA (4-oxalocrotonate tautomerase family)
MPLVMISVRKVFSPEEKQEISVAVHRCLVEEIGIPDSDFNHRILELDEGEWNLPAGRSERFVCVEIRMYPGRTPEMKRNLFRAIERRLAPLDVPAEDVFIVIDEPPKENWSVSTRGT